MDPTSPAKRRALAPLNANAMSPTTKLGAKPTPQLRGTSPTKPSGLKRPLQVFGADENGAAKKVCQEPQGRPDVMPRSVPVERAETTTTQPRERSTSPDGESVFDNSGMEGSQEDTTLTEPDAGAAAAATAAAVAATTTLPALPVAAAPRPRRVMTREQARQNAEILRLRLGLANYKLRTGQTNVPLENLEVRPVSGLVSLRRQASGPSSSQETTSTQQTSDAARSGQGAPEVQSQESQRSDGRTRGVRFAEGTTTPERSAAMRATPPEGESGASDEQGPAAANGLLSLARGR